MGSREAVPWFLGLPIGTLLSAVEGKFEVVSGGVVSGCVGNGGGWEVSSRFEGWWFG